MNKKTDFYKTVTDFVLYWLPVFIWGTVIFSFSSTQTHPVSIVHWQDFIVKKTAHLTEYAIFALLIFRALSKSGLGSLKSFYTTMIVCFIYALTDEYHQNFTPGREPALRDVLIDTWGSTITLLVIRDLLPKIKGNLRNIILKFGIMY